MTKQKLIGPPPPHTHRQIECVGISKHHVFHATKLGHFEELKTIVEMTC